MKKCSGYRAQAREALAGNWMTSALFYFVYLLIASVLSSAVSFVFSGASVLGSLLLLPMAYGVAIAFLRLLRAEEMQIEWLFENYNSRVWCTGLLQYVYILLWSLLLIIPGIIKSYSYSMAYFLLKDDPELQPAEAIHKSQVMMKGHKMDLFLLDLSFLGWIILSVFTCFIGMLWVAPYMSTARAAFYEDLKVENAL